ncbi:CD209 antigen-like protein E [Nematostella vectensis]|uniref:CD209 antigen-like protein E n=1 Tax=Nematostella vectensis TaxID=45351 RepID=UPI0020771060|nr:CD209 antigen-like protein E [Nematostella vectensis]
MFSRMDAAVCFFVFMVVPFDFSLSTSMYFKGFRHKFLEGPIISEFSVQSDFECFQKCLRDSHCSSVNIKTITEESSLCRLIGNVSKSNCKHGLEYTHYKKLSLALCPLGWHHHANNCYVIKFENVTWQVAMQRCHSVDSAMVSISSVEENAFVRGLFYSDTIWLGLEDFSSGSWRWEDGSPASFTYWQASAPSGQLGQDCVKMSHQRGKWNDCQCDLLLPYVCKMPENAITPFC